MGARGASATTTAPSLAAPTTGGGPVAGTTTVGGVGPTTRINFGALAGKTFAEARREAPQYCDYALDLLKSGKVMGPLRVFAEWVQRQDAAEGLDRAAAAAVPGEPSTIVM